MAGLAYFGSMSDSADRRSSGSGVTWASGVVGGLLLYALSIAPVVKLVTVIYGPFPPSYIERSLTFFYTPVGMLIGGIKPVEKFYLWYFERWDL